MASEPVTPKQVYDALIRAGASTIQALGIMANIIAESGFDAGAVGDQGTSFGLVQQHGAYGYLVTGNAVADMERQIALIKQNGGFGAASGSTAAQAAGNFAAGYERCVGCQPGGAQYQTRMVNAAQVEQWLKTGKWPTSGGTGGGGGGAPGGGDVGAGGAGGYMSGIPQLSGQIQTTSFFGDIFSIITDPFKALISSAGSMADFFSDPFVGFLDVFKTLTVSIGGLFSGLDTIIHDLLWLFNPTHWIRVFLFVFGLLVAIPALYALMHTGTGDMYLAMGIALTVVAGSLLFLAFHNLPFAGPGQPASSRNVITWQSLLAYVSEGVRTGAEPGTGPPVIAT